MELVTFLEARITEDRVLATRREWHTTDCDTIPNEAGYSYPCDCGVPERMVREADAKQRILEHEQAVNVGENLMYDVTFSVDSSDVLRLLALPYADHPDYQPEWRPEETAHQ